MSWIWHKTMDRIMWQEKDRESEQIKGFGNLNRLKKICLMAYEPIVGYSMLKFNSFVNV